MTTTINEQRQRSLDLQQRAAAIMNRADQEGRDLTADEAGDFDATYAEFERVRGDIERRERLENSGAQLAQPAGSGAANGGHGGAAAGNGNGNGAHAHVLATATNRRPLQSVPAGHAAPAARGGENAGGGYRIEVQNRAAGTYGFRDLGEFAIAVRNASVAGRSVDPRLLNSAGPPDNVMTEGVNADGGYAVPPDFRPDIQTLILAEDSLLAMTDTFYTSSNAITIPTDPSAPWQATGGIQAYWEAEAAQKKNSKLPLDQVTVRLFKLYALIPVSDELLEDAPALANLLNTKAPQVMDYKVTEAILYGTGAGEPQGIYNSPAAITVARQTAGAVTATDIVNMWAACYSASRKRAVWITNQDIESSFMTMFLPILDGGGQVVNGAVIYMPPGGFSQAPYGTLMGRPVISTEAAPDLGQPGDLALVDLESYLSAMKTGGGIKRDISIHLWFDWDITCFRFVLRVGGTPWWKAPVPSRSGTRLRSPFVLLGDATLGATGTRRAGGILSPTERRRRELEGLEAETTHPAVAGVRASNERAEALEADRAKQREAAAKEREAAAAKEREAAAAKEESGKRPK
jgi:HK97 family phage major capsid protein